MFDENRYINIRLIVKLIQREPNYYLMCGEHLHTWIIEIESLKINERGLNVIHYGFVNTWQHINFRTRPDRPLGSHSLLYNGYRV